MSFWVYVLKNDLNRSYIGYTSDLFQRVLNHKSGKSKWTSRFKGWHLVYQEEYKTRTEAIKREKELKSGKGRDELKRRGIL